MDYPGESSPFMASKGSHKRFGRAMLLLRDSSHYSPKWRACSQANDGLGNRINFKVNLRSWRYCLGGRLTFWWQRHDPKQGVGTRLHCQISLDYYTIPPAMQATLKFDIEGWKYRQQNSSHFSCYMHIVPDCCCS